VGSCAPSTVAADDATVATAYPPDAMIEIASALLADKDPAVRSFLAQFTITSDDQMSMLPAVEIDGDDPADVAAAWIDEHVDVWEPWLNPAPASSMP
jgi:ABC-type proline/glycine betaine transport system substrate-binding protein